jgi:hypothetical protein
MPDIDWLGEIGPSVRWVAWRDPSSRTRLTLEAPFRAVFSTDFSHIRYRGYVFAPELAIERSALGFPGARARIGIGPVYEQQPGIGLAIRKEILHRRGVIASPALRPPGARLDDADRAELDRLVLRLERRVAAGL